MITHIQTKTNHAEQTLFIIHYFHIFTLKKKTKTEKKTGVQLLSERAFRECTDYAQMIFQNARHGTQSCLLSVAGHRL